jgi:hypothetical protein
LAALGILAGEAQSTADAVADSQLAETNRIEPLPEWPGQLSRCHLRANGALLAKPGQHAPMKPAVLQ